MQHIPSADRQTRHKNENKQLVCNFTVTYGYCYIIIPKSNKKKCTIQQRSKQHLLK